MNTILLNLKNNLETAIADEQRFISDKDNFIQTLVQRQLNDKSETLGYQYHRLQSHSMIAEIYNREAASGRYPEKIRNNGMSVSLIYSPNCSIRELHKRANTNAADEYVSTLKRLSETVAKARKAIGDALATLQAEQAERDAQEALILSLVEAVK